MKLLGMIPNSELKLASGSRYNKIIKLALVKSIDKYTEIRDRLEALERQTKLILSQAYTGAKTDLTQASNTPSVEPKLIKSLTKGVKRLLEEKTVLLENMKTHDMKLQRIDANGVI
jgi:glycine cleavage system regulatory protein